MPSYLPIEFLVNFYDLSHPSQTRSREYLNQMRPFKVTPGVIE
jgi:hypothetical protein